MILLGGLRRTELTKGQATMTPRLAIGTIVATFAYLGLAVLGGGGFAVFFSHTPLIALAIALFVLSGAALFSGGNLSPGEREDRANRWVILAFALIGLLSAYLPAYTDRKEFWTIDGESIRWLGIVLFAAGGALRIWSVFVLGRRFSGLVAIQPGHTLVTSGAYGVIRHPSYLGLLVNYAGVGPRLSFGGRPAAHRIAYPAASRAHTCGRDAAAQAVRRRVRYLLQLYVTTARSLLGTTGRRSSGTGRRPGFNLGHDTAGLGRRPVRVAQPQGIRVAALSVLSAVLSIRNAEPWICIAVAC